MHKHKLKFLRQSIILYKGKSTTIDIYQCIDCKKYCIINTKTDSRISLNGDIGEEIDD